MVSVGRIVVGVGASAAAAVTLRALVRSMARSGGWKSVTVLADAEQLTVDGVYPGPLASLGDAVEVRLDEAPAGQGTVLSARVAPGAAASERVRSISGVRPDDAVRAALRDAKSLIETGQVLRIDPRPHGTRPETPTGKLIDAFDHTKGKGIL